MLSWFGSEAGPDMQRSCYGGHCYGLRLVPFHTTKRRPWERTSHELRALFYEHGDLTHAVTLGCFLRHDIESAVQCCESHAAMLVLEQLG